MFQFTAFPFCKLWIYLQMTELFSAGFPHSDICGSIPICDSPQLFAAYHVLRRLPVPRHSPCALSCLTVITFVISECSSVYISFFFFDVSIFFLTICLCPCSVFKVLWQRIIRQFFVLISSHETTHQISFLAHTITTNRTFARHKRYLISLTSGDCEIRTRDPLLARQVLSQLS